MGCQGVEWVRGKWWRRGESGGVLIRGRFGAGRPQRGGLGPRIERGRRGGARTGRTRGTANRGREMGKSRNRTWRGERARNDPRWAAGPAVPRSAQSDGSRKMPPQAHSIQIALIARPAARPRPIPARPVPIPPSSASPLSVGLRPTTLAVTGRISPRAPPRAGS